MNLLRPRRTTLIAALAGAIACGPSPTGPDASGNQTGQNVEPVALTPVAPTAEWPTSTPAAEGLDPARLTDVLNRIRRREYGAVDSLLVVRNERLVVEEYFNGFAASIPHTQQSVTKSVTSLAAGLAVLVVPDRRLVLVTTANNTNQNFDAGVRILYDHVLPALAP